MENRDQKVGILIPTMNRSDFMIRQLRYYASVKCPHTLYIGDSSTTEQSEKIKEEINRLKTQINVVYEYLPNVVNGSTGALKHLLCITKEKYTCFSGDDDYQIPSSLTKCADFLENNPSYATASGYAISFRLKNASIHGELNRLADYPRQQIELETASERLMAFFNNYYVSLFSVNRTSDLLESHRNALLIKDVSFGSEILPCSLALLKGKSKILDCLGFVRQIHDSHFSLPDIYDWITKPIWHESYKVFAETLTQELTQKDNITNEQALKIVKQAFWCYLNKHFLREYNLTFPPKKEMKKIIHGIKKIRHHTATTFPIIKYLYRSKFKPIWTKKPELNFEVLNSKSKYYQDFIAVRRSFGNELAVDNTI